MGIILSYTLGTGKPAPDAGLGAAPMKPMLMRTVSWLDRQLEGFASPTQKLKITMHKGIHNFWMGDKDEPIPSMQRIQDVISDLSPMMYKVAHRVHATSNTTFELQKAEVWI